MNVNVLEEDPYVAVGPVDDVGVVGGDQVGVDAPPELGAVSPPQVTPVASAPPEGNVVARSPSVAELSGVEGGEDSDVETPVFVGEKGGAISAMRGVSRASGGAAPLYSPLVRSEVGVAVVEVPKDPWGSNLADEDLPGTMSFRAEWARKVTVSAMGGFDRHTVCHRDNSLLSQCLTADTYREFAPIFWEMIFSSGLVTLCNMCPVYVQMVHVTVPNADLRLNWRAVRYDLCLMMFRECVLHYTSVESAVCEVARGVEFGAGVRATQEVREGSFLALYVGFPSLMLRDEAKCVDYGVRHRLSEKSDSEWVVVWDGRRTTEIVGTVVQWVKKFFPLTNAVSKKVLPKVLGLCCGALVNTPADIRKPNAEICWRNSLVPYIRATRAIRSGEMVTLDYGPDHVFSRIQRFSATPALWNAVKMVVTKCGVMSLEVPEDMRVVHVKRGEMAEAVQLGQFDPVSFMPMPDKVAVLTWDGVCVRVGFVCRTYSPSVDTVGDSGAFRSVFGVRFYEKPFFIVVTPIV
jgi:hypothetical protein